MNIVEFLRSVGDDQVRALVGVILDYEMGVDGEFGCCHTAEQIANGECGPLADIEGLRILAQPYAWHVSFRKEWSM